MDNYISICNCISNCKRSILVWDNIVSKKTNRVGKYLMQISIRELYNDLIKLKNEGGLSKILKGYTWLVSDTGLQCIISINVK